MKTTVSSNNSGAVLAGIVTLALLPLASLPLALFRAVLLFYPLMLVLGAAHSYVAWIPALGWSATFWVIAALALLGSSLGTGTASQGSK